LPVAGQPATFDAVMLHCTTEEDGALPPPAPPAGPITYEHPGLRQGGPCEVLPGTYGVRLELPFALDHVNIWLCAERDGWTAIDAGLADEPTRERWRDLRRGLLADRPIGRVLATHYHPDHMGLAGWLCAQFEAEFWTSRTEWLTARLLAHEVSDEWVAAGRRFDRRAGLDEQLIEERAGRGNLYRRRVVPPPAAFRRVRDGERLRLGEADWEVIVGRGHAPEMICLFSAERNVLIAGDQILPRISPNVSVWPSEPEADPLGDFLCSLACFRELPEDCLVLPSHGLPFRGLRARIDQLVAHHEERLAATRAACAAPTTIVELMPKLFDRPLDGHQLQFALGESIAHVNHLVEKGELTRRLDADGRLRYRVR
jgi:glyoxylase-like metal-dependent hydrolase (beta-lactamase superfamily II)